MVPDSSGAKKPSLESMTNSNDATDLEQLADLIRMRNENEVAITRVVDRPALLGHIGEYIASQVFNIALAPNATNPGIDGWFRSSSLAGKSVDVKTYAKREGVLDIKPEQLPDYYLVLAGPKSSAASSRGTARPWGIKEVFLFEAAPLVARLRQRPVKVGIATSVHQAEWERARIFPASPAAPLRLTADEQAALRRFDLYA